MDGAGLASRLRWTPGEPKNYAILQPFLVANVSRSPGPPALVVCPWPVPRWGPHRQGPGYRCAVVVARVIEAQINAGRRVVGTVMPLRSSTIGSAVDGRVVEFFIDHGDPVKEGEPLARLRSETLEIELAAAQAELRLFEQQLAELVNRLMREDINEARAKMLGAKAAMQNAATKLQRLETLSPTHAISETELGDARERAEFARHVLAAAQALLDRVEQGPRIEQIYQAEARVELQKQTPG